DRARDRRRVAVEPGGLGDAPSLDQRRDGPPGTDGPPPPGPPPELTRGTGPLARSAGRREDGAVMARRPGGARNLATSGRFRPAGRACAEGTGVEPAGRCPAPVFETG